MKYHFVDLRDDVKMILGMNGLIWVYYSTIKLEQEYFSEDLSKIESAARNEVEMTNNIRKSQKVQQYT